MNITDTLNQSTLVGSPDVPVHQKLGAGFALTMLLLLVTATLIFYLVHTSQMEVASDDFFIEWKGSQIALQGGDPYSPAATRQIQYGLHRYNVTSDQDQLAFVYPYWRVFYNAPLNLLPYNWAAAVWLALRLTLFGASIFLVCRSIGWRPQRLQAQLALYLSLILAFPTFAALMEGQVALFSSGLLVLAYYCLRNGAQTWAGVWLALATVKPQLAAVLVLLLIGRAIWRHEWKFVSSFLATLAVLVIASFAVYPAWLGEFLDGISRYPGYKKSLTGPGFLFDGLGIIGTILSVSVWLLITGVGLWWWGREASSPAVFPAKNTESINGLDLSFCIGIFLTLLLPPQTNIVNAVLLQVPVLLLMAHWARGSQKARFYAMAIATVILSWVFYFWLYNDFYGWLIVLPVTIVAALFIFTFKAQFVALSRLRIKEQPYAT